MPQNNRLPTCYADCYLMNSFVCRTATRVKRKWLPCRSFILVNTMKANEWGPGATTKQVTFQHGGLRKSLNFLIGQQVFSNRYNKNTGQGRILSKLTNFNSYAGVLALCRNADAYGEGWGRRIWTVPLNFRTKNCCYGNRYWTSLPIIRISEAMF